MKNLAKNHRTKIQQLTSFSSILGHFSVFSVVFLILVLAPLGTEAYARDYSKPRSRETVGYTVENVLKLRCFQCNQPYDCETGVCYGDICVKSLVNNHYVSKGCENLTISGNVYEPHLRMKSYCKEEEVLGVDTVNCYCRDTDFCNSSHFQAPPTFLITILLFFSPLIRLYEIM